VDYDGQLNYSKVISAKVDREDSSINIFPNPATHSVTLALETDYQGEAVFTLYELMGRQMKKVTVSAEGGFSRSDIGLVGLPPGIYLAELRAGAEIWRERLIVE